MYKKLMSHFENSIPEYKLINIETGIEYKGDDILSRYLEKKPINFALAECIYVHDTDGVIMYRGDLIEGSIDGKKFKRGVVDYCQKTARYYIYWSDGLKSYFGEDADEYKYIEIVGHSSVAANANKEITNNTKNFENERKHKNRIQHFGRQIDG